MITQEDLMYLSSKGISEAQLSQQVESFKNGFSFSQLIAAAVLNDGITRLEDLDTFIAIYESSEASAVKFVPASGAASRMFKLLYKFVDGSEDLDEDNPVFNFFKRIEDFAFYDDLKAAFKSLHGYSLEEAHLKKEYRKILKVLLDPEGLNYGKLPKGLLQFHSYDENTRKPAKEHIIEGLEYANKNGKVNLHFTVSPEHVDLFKSYVNESVSELNSEVSINSEYSVQNPATDTVAVTLDNVPYKVDGKLFFRPAGHGALLQNLNGLKEDIVFIKNIDNVVPDRLKAETIKYKKALAGLLIGYQQKTFDLLKRNENGEDIAKEGADLLKDLGVKGNLSKTQIIEKLNRPIRVCGMVKNEGEPGGGPFWVKEKDGTESLQIVESVQIDSESGEQMDLLKSSTHFNPVDLICGLKNYKGEKFDLIQYRDMDAGIITEKSVGSDQVKAMELPGLWNGSMADWNTVFVEVPLITFNPVKTVMDLLRPEHQPA